MTTKSDTYVSTDEWRQRLAEMLAEHERRRRRKSVDRAALKVARAVGVDWKTANRHLEDLRLLGLAELAVERVDEREKPTYWHRASRWLRDHFPAPVVVDEKYLLRGTGFVNRGSTHHSEASEDVHTPTHGETPRSFRPIHPTWASDLYERES